MKKWYEKFEPSKWVQDTKMLTLSAKGAWIDLLCAMSSAQSRGRLTMTTEGYARLLGATIEQVERVMTELTDMNICDIDPPDFFKKEGAKVNMYSDVSRGHVPKMSPKCPDMSLKCPAVFSIINRRMCREEKEKDYERLKKQRQRDKAKCPADVPVDVPIHSNSNSNSNSKGSSSNEEFSPPEKPPDCEVKTDTTPQKILDLFRERLPELKQTDGVIWTPTDHFCLEGALNRYPEKDFWEKVFTLIRGSSLLMGKKKGWKATLSWVIRPENLDKVLSGKYSDFKETSKSEFMDEALKHLEKIESMKNAALGTS